MNVNGNSEDLIFNIELGTLSEDINDSGEPFDSEDIPIEGLTQGNGS